MKTTLNISMVITLAIAIAFSVIFAYSNVDNTGLATLLFLAMTAGLSTLIVWGYRELYHFCENRRNNINTLKEQIANIRENIESTLLAVMRHHDVETIQCDGFSNTPVISNDVDTFTLNEIQLCRTINGDEYIIFEGSSDHDNIYITAKSMDIEYLIGIYEWVKENQEELFEVEEDE
jgi:hypothetical protein